MRWIAILLFAGAMLGRPIATIAESPDPAGPATAPLVVLAWGNNDEGQLGDGNRPSDGDSARVVRGPGGIGHLDTVTAISAGAYHALALDRDGTVWSWGYNAEGQLGDGNMPTRQELPIRVLNSTGEAPLNHVVAIAAGSYHNLALKDDGTLWAWGDAGDGQLGDGQTATNQDLPVQVKDEAGTGVLTDVVQIAAGYDHSLAMTGDGAVYAWGDDGEGQLGNGLPHTESSLPVRVRDSSGTGFLSGVKSLAASAYASFAVTNSGGLVAWGYNDEGQMGDASITQRDFPVVVKGMGGNGALASIRDISPGTYHILAALNDGTALSWGYNNYGQLANGTLSDDRFVPGAVLVGGDPMKDVVAVDGGYYHGLAVRKDGTVWAWGRDSDGQVGNGATTGEQTEAVQVKNSDGTFVTNVIDVSAGVDSYTSYALARTATAKLKAPATTRSAAISVTMKGSSVFGVDGYFIGESPVPPSADSDAWLSTPPVAYTIQKPGDGVKTLYAFTRDAEDYVSPPAIAKVRLDATAPGISFELPPFTGDKQTSLKLRGSDAGGVVGYMVKSSPARPSARAAGWKSTAPKTFNLTGADGVKKLYAWVKDAAGNVSQTKSDTTVLDTKPPGVTINTPAQGAKLGRLRTIAGRSTDARAGSGVKTQRAAIQRKQGAACSWWDVKTEKLVAGPCGAPKWFSLPAAERWAKEIGELDVAGSYTLYVESVDRASNRSRATRSFAITAGGESALFR